MQYSLQSILRHRVYFMKIHCLGCKLVYQQLQVLSRHINLHKLQHGVHEEKQVLPCLSNPCGYLKPRNFLGLSLFRGRSIAISDFIYIRGNERERKNVFSYFILHCFCGGIFQTSHNIFLHSPFCRLEGLCQQTAIREVVGERDA